VVPPVAGAHVTVTLDVPAPETLVL